MNTKTAILSHVVSSDSERQKFLPKNIGHRLFLAFENAVYQTACSYCRQYSGGMWEFISLDNDGFFMYPKMDAEQVEFANPENWSNVLVSPVALGIICTLYALSLYSTDRHVAEKFHLLRQYALDHPEVSAIFEAID